MLLLFPFCLNVVGTFRVPSGVPRSVPSQRTRQRIVPTTATAPGVCLLLRFAAHHWASDATKITALDPFITTVAPARNSASAMARPKRSKPAARPEPRSQVPFPGFSSVPCGYVGLAPAIQHDLTVFTATKSIGIAPLKYRQFLHDMKDPWPRQVVPRAKRLRNRFLPSDGV